MTPTPNKQVVERVAQAIYALAPGTHSNQFQGATLVTDYDEARSRGIRAAKLAIEQAQAAIEVLSSLPNEREMIVEWLRGYWEDRHVDRFEVASMIESGEHLPSMGRDK